MRDLEECCEQYDFHTELNGNVYCSLGINKQVECVYHAKEPDQNGIRPCYHPFYQIKENKYDWN